MAREKNITLPTKLELRAKGEDEQLEAELIKRGVVPEGYIVTDELGKELEPLADSPALNRLLLRHARKSNNEISKLTGIPVGEVAERLESLLDNRLWRDDLMEEKLLLAEIAMLIEDIRERMSRFGTEDEGWASMARVQLAAIKTILEQMDKRRKAVDGQLQLVNMLQAQMIADAIKIAREKAIQSIARKYPEIDVEVIYAEFDEEFPKAIAFLEGHTND